MPRTRATRQASVTLNSVWYASGLVIGQATTAVLYILFARNFPPRDYGIVVAELALAYLVVNTLNFGWSTYVIRELSAGTMRPAEFVSRWSLKAKISLLACLAYALVVWLAANAPLSRAAGLASLALGSALVQCSLPPLNSQSRFASVSLINLVEKSVALLTGSLSLYLFHSGASGLIWSLGAGVMTSAILARLAWPRAFVEAYRGSRTQRRAAWLNPWAGSRHFGMASLVASLQSIDIWILSRIGSAADAGVYGAVARWTQPVLLAANAYTQVRFPQMASAPSHREAWRVLWRGRWLLGPVVLCTALAAAFAPALVGVLLGTAYASSAPVLRVLCLGVTASLLNQCLSTYLQARREERFTTWSVCISIMVQTGLLFWLSYLWGAMGAAAAYTAGQGVLLILAASRTQRMR